ncbi:hypothetical protein DITRI_Ditri10aG0000700 [Diplodiscus trichospermus]
MDKIEEEEIHTTPAKAKLKTMASISSLYWHCCYVSSCFNRKDVILKTNKNDRKQLLPSFCCCCCYNSHPLPQHEQNKNPLYLNCLFNFLIFSLFFLFCSLLFCVSMCHSICVKQVEEDGLVLPTTSTRRRQIMLQAPLIAFSFPQLFMSNFNALALPGNDMPQDFREYTDDANKFKISIPQDWRVGVGEPNGFKSITAFYPEEAANSNVSIVITGLGPDFTRMESFGKVEAFADTLVSGLDRSWQRPPGVAAKLIDCKAANGFYYIEYTLQNPGESRKHLFSAIGMASNGWYNRLYTVTGQFVEEEAEKYGSRIEKLSGLAGCNILQIHLKQQSLIKKSLFSSLHPGI